MKCLHYCADFVVSGLWGAHFYAAYLLKSPPPPPKKKKKKKSVQKKKIKLKLEKSDW